MIETGKYILWVNDPHNAKIFGEKTIGKILAYNKNRLHEPEYLVKFPDYYNSVPQFIEAYHIERCKVITKEDDPEEFL